jgi:ring-1,2-phenylacetyl-CoA epoxidase subunit PaaD
VSDVDTTIDLDAVEAAVRGVPDPELPALTLGMLGVVHEVTVDDGIVEVVLLPTFVGCPATEVMARDVRAVVEPLDCVREVRVRFVHAPAWSPDRISADGHEALRSFGIAPPERRLPVVAGQAELPRACPYCGSTRTERDGIFGPTPCRDVRLCLDCHQPFEAFRT